MKTKSSEYLQIASSFVPNGFRQLKHAVSNSTHNKLTDRRRQGAATLSKYLMSNHAS